MRRYFSRIVSVLSALALTAASVFPVYAEGLSANFVGGKEPEIVKGTDTSGSGGWEEFNPYDSNSWWIDKSDKNKIVLTKYVGSSSKIYIPGTYEGKSIEMNNTYSGSQSVGTNFFQQHQRQ